MGIHSAIQRIQPFLLLRLPIVRQTEKKLTLVLEYTLHSTVRPINGLRHEALQISGGIVSERIRLAVCNTSRHDRIEVNLKIQLGL